MIKVFGLFTSLQRPARFLASALALIVLFGCGKVPSFEATGSNDSSLSELVETPFWQVNKAGDEALVSGHSLSPYFVAAKAKSLPTNYFRDLISGRKSVNLRYGDWPRYQPGSASGTIYHPMVGKPFSEWRSLDWSSFYNELYHAWWGLAFTSSSKYAADRSSLLTAERQTHYRRAHPTDPRLAQEEAYSETVAVLMIYLYPRYAPSLPSQKGFSSLSEFVYNKGKTVSPVSHSDRPGFTPEAENTYPNEFEYGVVLRQLTDHLPPESEFF